jgi:DNA-binding Xre family transcriptional regulator
MDKCVELTAENQRLREDQRRLEWLVQQKASVCHVFGMWDVWYDEESRASEHGFGAGAKPSTWLWRTAMTDHAQQCEQLLHDTRLRLVKAGSLKRLAQRTGLPRNTLFNIRDGHTASPRLGTLIQIHRALDDVAVRD